MVKLKYWIFMTSVIIIDA